MQQRIRHILLIIILYGTMLLFGFVDNVKGVSYPLIKTEFNVPYEQQGMMVSLLTAGYVFFCVMAGILLSRFGVKRVFLWGFAGVCAAQALVFFMPAFWPVVAALLVLFAGFGFFEIGINALATELFTSKAALLMNLLHLFYGLGAVLGPKAAGILTSTAGLGLGWRHIYLWCLPLVLLFFIPAIVTPFPREEKNEASAPRTTFLGALKVPVVWLMGTSLGIMVSIEMATANWGGLYFQDVYGFDPSTRGANFVSAFFIVFTASRLVSGFLVEKLGYMKSLLAASAATALFLAAGFIAGPLGIWILPWTGFFIAIMWPTMMALAIGRFGGETPIMTSAVIAISGTLNALIQLFIGYFNRFLGAAWGYRSCLAYSVISVILLVLLHLSLDHWKRTRKFAAA